ncbi:MAG: radical SAM protein [Deltaproteobacteria bacterium]|jgi:hypothetical protein|nr:radical SAM protein [Deltaproteobacteria bacterium]
MATALTEGREKPPVQRSELESPRDPNEILIKLKGPKFARYRRDFSLAVSGQRPHFPLHLDVDITTVCQLACPMCPAGQKDPQFPSLGLFLPESLYLAALREGGKYGLPSLRLGMTGEPLLVPDIDNWVTAARDFGVMDLSLITNGQYLTPYLSRKLILSGLTRLMISVDAASSDTYQKIRPGGNFDLLLENIKSFLAIRKNLGSVTPLLRLSFVDMSLNASEKSQFRALFGPLADYLSIQNYQNILGRDETAWGLRPSEGGLCTEPRTRLALLADGGLFPCCSDFGRLTPLGRFPDLSLYEAWNCPSAADLAQGGQNHLSCRLCRQAANPECSAWKKTGTSETDVSGCEPEGEINWPHLAGTAHPVNPQATTWR